MVFSTFWVEKRLWGLHPLGYHLVNVLLHAGSALLLWWLLRRFGLPGAAFAAALFALHPVCVESVAWVTERKNPLSFFLTLLAAHTYLGSSEARAAAHEKHGGRKARPEWPWYRRPGTLYAAALASFTLALCAKTTAALLPPVLLVLIWWRKGRLRWADVRPLVPFFTVGVALAWHTAWLEKTMVRAVGTEWSLGLLGRVVLAGRVAAFYAAKLAWPADLAFIYPRWVINTHVWWQWLPAPAALAVLAALVACGLASLLPSQPTVRRVAAGVGLVVLAALAILSFRQSRVYRDADTLWTDTLAKNPDCFMCHTNYGYSLYASGRVADAIEHFEASLRLKPDNVLALLKLARVEEQRGRLDEAIARLCTAQSIDRTDTTVMVNLGTVFTKARRYEEATAQFEEALRNPSPDDYLAHNGLGVALIRSGKTAEAVEQFQEAVRLRPDFWKARANLERALEMLNTRH